MKKSVKTGICETYYKDLIKDYRAGREKSFLYRAFWAESVKELLKESLPPLPKKNALKEQVKILNEKFLKFLADEENGPEQMEEYFTQLPEEVKELLKVHMPQLPEGIMKLMKKHIVKLPEEVEELLQGRFPWLLEEETAWPGYGSKIRELLKENMLERPDWACKVLKQKPPQRTEKEQGAEQEKQKKERRDFWEELMLNDAGYEAGLITDTEYYLWLTEYLAARGIYYKDNSMRDGHKWLYELLCKGLGRELGEPVGIEKPRGPKEPGVSDMHRGSGEDIRDKIGVGQDLAELAEKFRHEVETGGTEISNRLHGLKCTRMDRVRREDYLPWLTRQLEKMAIHIKIKTWLQDNGYPIADGDKAKENARAKKLLQERRKQDFSMQLFGAYCDSEKGYDFIPKEEGGREADEGWVVTNGFCVWNPDGCQEYLQELLQVLEQEGREDFYIPLAIDLYSGCVFFLAGKEYYAEVYEKSNHAGLLEKYEKKDAFFCYDFLRLDKREGFGDLEVAFRLQPTFHKNAGRSYDEVLDDFKWYCGSDTQMEVQNTDGGESYYYEDVSDRPRKKIKAYNEERLRGIPAVFQWLFDGSEDSGASPMAKADYEKTQKKIAQNILIRWR